MTFEQLYNRALYGCVPIHCGIDQLKVNLENHPDTGSVYNDIQLHLPVLEWFASRCDRVVEFGVRNVRSTLALLAGARVRVDSYDIVRTPFVDELIQAGTPVAWTFHHQSSIEPGLNLGPIDMLFIDTEHTGKQITAELNQHWDSVVPGGYIALHDTETFWDRHGFGQALIDFLDSDRILPWKTVYRTRHNNGLWVIQKT